jgi:serine/threonine protein kinase
MQQIGKFQLEKSLGRGASGIVYLARDTFSGESVALKVLDQDAVKNPKIGKKLTVQFMNEASLAGKLAHPHIATIIEASVTDEYGYIAIEYVAGGDLTRFTRSENLLPPEELTQIAFKSCGALDYAYRQGIVHRDLKPANLLMVGPGNIKIGDFGAAYLFHSQDTQITNIGSPTYMSPEQIRGDELGYSSDMFSLGIVLYQLFTGHRPFYANTLAGVAAKTLRESPAVPSSLREGIDREMDDIILRMLAKTQAERYPSWADLALDIAKVGRLSRFQTVVPDSEKFVALKSVRLLGHLDDPELWELAYAGKWSWLPARTIITQEGESGSSLFFLGSGQAKVTKQGRLLNVLDAGECVGDMSYIKEGAIPRQATVETLTEVLLVEFEKEILDKVSVNCRYQLALALMHSLVERLALGDERLVQAG